MISKFTTKLKRLKVKLLSRRVITLLKKTLISHKLINLIEIWNLPKLQIPRSSGPNHQQLGNLQLQRKTRHPRSSCPQQRINSKKINRGSLRSCQKEKRAPNTTIWAKGQRSPQMTTLLRKVATSPKAICSRSFATWCKSRGLTSRRKTRLLRELKSCWKLRRNFRMNKWLLKNFRMSKLVKRGWKKGFKYIALCWLIALLRRWGKLISKTLPLRRLTGRRTPIKS